MKKRLAIFGVIAALLMLAACSAAAPEYGTEQTQEQEQIVLHLFHYQGEAEEAYGHVIAAYEKAPTASIAAPPDVFPRYSGHLPAPSVTASSLLSPIPSLF